MVMSLADFLRCNNTRRQRTLLIIRLLLVSITFSLPDSPAFPALFAQEPEEEVTPLDSSTAQDRSVNVGRGLDVISIGAEVVASPGGSEFFREYQKLGGEVAALDLFLAPTLIGRFSLGRSFRLIVYSAFMSASFVEIYNSMRLRPDDSTSTGDPVAAITEDFSMQSFPILAGFEYSPIQSQFSTYVGLLGGLAIVSGTWQTSVRPFAPGEFYRPLVNLSGLSVSPAIRAYTGVDLRFDRYLIEGTAVRGIFLEAAFLMLPVNRPFFEDIRQQSRGLSLIPTQDNATLSIGGFTVTLGINFQVQRR
jgi:hypothetical protein